MPDTSTNIVNPRRLDLVLWDLMKLGWHTLSFLVLSAGFLGLAVFWRRGPVLDSAIDNLLFPYGMIAFAVCVIAGCFPAVGVLSHWRSRPTSNPFVASFRFLTKPALYALMYAAGVSCFVHDGKWARGQLVTTPTGVIVLSWCVFMASSILWGQLLCLKFYFKSLRSRLWGKTKPASRPSRRKELRYKW